MENLKWVFVLHLFFFCVKLQFVSCSQSSSSDPTSQQKLDRVLHLPGQNFNVSFAHYSGYITVNEDSGRALFYWFIEAAEDPSSKPFAIWLNGGPGCSSIAFGEAQEVGPFHIEADGNTLSLNPYSWNQGENFFDKFVNQIW
ncbi:hypothetical protein HHK36_013781 [Tetracentron sinense]|uniref:Uncharacterized protein n=1 Tax=Tetracentron sinense TaxID=13715 RepID=A0A835DEH7_TETSI|nr:hypothetical protein HHK36_013781 [Tetracentron sinense]